MKKKNLLNLMMLIILTSCGGSGGGGDAGGGSASEVLNVSILDVKAVEHYTGFIPDETKDYKSFYYFGIVLDPEYRGRLAYFVGKVNDYKTDKDGNEKPGSEHPDSDILVSHAVYDYSQVAEGHKLKFASIGTCDETYPFKSRVFKEDTPIKITKSGEFLDIELIDGKLLRLKKDNFLKENSDAIKRGRCGND